MAAGAMREFIVREFEGATIKLKRASVGAMD